MAALHLQTPHSMENGHIALALQIQFKCILFHDCLYLIFCYNNITLCSDQDLLQFIFAQSLHSPSHLNNCWHSSTVSFMFIVGAFEYEHARACFHLRSESSAEVCPPCVCLLHTEKRCYIKIKSYVSIPTGSPVLIIGVCAVYVSDILKYKFYEIILRNTHIREILIFTELRLFKRSTDGIRSSVIEVWAWPVQMAERK